MHQNKKQMFQSKLSRQQVLIISLCFH